MSIRKTPGFPRTALGSATLAILAVAVMPGATQADATAGYAASPNILFVTVDTLRPDRLSINGYHRPTSPNIDRLMSKSIRFDQARTVEPLTGPALCSMFTSTYPHEHGASRNGLRMRTGLASLPKTLQAHGYRTAAYVGSWTLKDKNTGLAEHFEEYESVLTRRRWYLFRSEATAEDLTELSTTWLSDHMRQAADQPFFLWVHYIDPHWPYRLDNDHAERLGIDRTQNVPAEDRYDTEIAVADSAIGQLLEALDRWSLTHNTIVVFASDHGESLGEHNYWGHGRNLYEPSLLIPMSISWPGRLEPQVIEAPALITDLAPTVLRLVGQSAPPGFTGYDWNAALDGATPPDRITYHEAHKGAVVSRHDSDLARRTGLLAVGVVAGQRKEVFRPGSGERLVFDLATDPTELESLTGRKEQPTEGLSEWLRVVTNSLAQFDDTLPQPLDEESIEQLRSLGYVD
jgi:arylsulfatase A-like enzyme